MPHTAIFAPFLQPLLSPAPGLHKPINRNPKDFLGMTWLMKLFCFICRLHDANDI